MKTADNSGEDRSLKAPERLVSALRRSQAEPVFVPPTVDEAIFRAARNHFAEHKKARFRWSSFLPWFAGATAVFVAVALVFVRFHPRPNGARTSIFAKEDVNHDGTVNILDAFAMARQLKQGRASDPRLDLNGDGEVDERDIGIIAAEAVKLDKGGRS